MLAWVHVALALTAAALDRSDLFHFGPEAGDLRLEPGSDRTHELRLDRKLYFFDGAFESVYINTNGFISMAKPPAESDYLGQMPASFGLAAAFMGDLDTSDGIGKVYFRQDSSASVLQRINEHISQAFPAEDEVEPTHAFIVTWENVAVNGESGRGDGTRNTFQLVVASMESASYAILLYPSDGLQFHLTNIGDESKPVEVGFSKGLVKGWFSWSTTQGPYYRITTDDVESIQSLTQQTNSGRQGLWVFEIGTSSFFTSITPGQVSEISPGAKNIYTEEAYSDETVIYDKDPLANETYPEDLLVVYREESYPEEPSPEINYPEEASSEAPLRPVDTSQFQPNYPHPRRQPENPQVLVVNEDDLEIDVFSYDYERCANSRQKCSSFADCRDYSGGFCCHCRPGFYGDGRDCVAEGKPQRMNGKVNGRVYVGNSPTALELNNHDLHSYVVANDGRAYVAISAIPDTLGPCLQPLASLGGVIGWAFALEQPGYHNGFSVVGGRFTRQAEVSFHSSNEKLTITQEFMGINEHDHLVVNTWLEGRLPEIPPGATVQINPYTEIYQYSRNVITSSSNRDYTITLPDSTVQTRSYHWKQTITYQSCEFSEAAWSPHSTQQLNVDQIFVMYDAGNQLIRYAMSNKIGSIHNIVPEQNPCYTGRHGCDSNAMCRAGTGTQFTCECAGGYTGDGRTCYDIDECRDTPQICGRHTICNNQPGSFRCECIEGFQFASDGRTCIEVEQGVDHCLRGSHDCDIPERARCRYTGGSSYVCACLTGFSGDGHSCQDIDECQPGRCHQDATCYNNQGSFTCQCHLGFHGNGFQCITDSEREKTPCEKHRESALAASAPTTFFLFSHRPTPQFVPTCDPYGAYEPTQCFPHAGQCWCVDRNGQEIQGTRSGDGSRPSCIDHGISPPLVGPTPRPDVSPPTPGTNLLFAQSGKIEHIPLDGYSMKKEEARTLLHVPDKVVIAVAFDCVEKMVYWSDITEPAISRVSLQGGQPTTLIKTDLGSPEGIAIDHLSRLMFWTDSIMDQIEVSKLDGSYRRVLFDEDLINPRPIVADPNNGRLYWADWNRDGPKIEMANMDGTDRTILVSENLGLPNGLTYDPLSRILCWADAGTRKVECVDPYSRYRKKVVEGIQYAFAVVSYGKSLFYTDWRREAIITIDRMAEKETDSFLPQRRSKPYGITTTYPQCPPGVNYCSANNGGCSHLCLPRPGGLTCQCPDTEDASCVERGHNL
uniref:Nidogen 1b n=1 Tax=Denticeps clupeoides TaxID=299321 RepID=A0AAY4EML9_9TELE